MLTPNELAEILNEVNENHSIYDMDKPDNKKAKYVDACMDTRDGMIWCVKIKFRELCSNLQSDRRNNAIVFTEENCTKEKILNWLRCN